MNGNDADHTRIEVQLNFMSMRRSADIGVVRASVFPGLAANATAANPPLSHVLDDRVQYRFVPHDIPAATAAHFNEEFNYWVIGNALRELVESFSAFLVYCRPVLQIIETSSVNKSEIDQLVELIKKRNISQQYQEIQAFVDIAPMYAEMFETFRRARNCLAHRRGVVSKRDVNTDDDHLRLRWCFMGTFLESPDGTETGDRQRHDWSDGSDRRRAQDYRAPDLEGEEISGRVSDQAYPLRPWGDMFWGSSSHESRCGEDPRVRAGAWNYLRQLAECGRGDS